MTIIHFSQVQPIKQVYTKIQITKHIFLIVSLEKKGGI